MSLSSSEKLEEYLTQIRLLSPNALENKEACETILRIIQQLKALISIEDPLYPILLGEEDFYNKFYERALRHYLKSRTIHASEFLCYRTAAYAAQVKDDISRATLYAKKALEIIPDDPLCLQLLKNISCSKPTPLNLIETPKEIATMSTDEADFLLSHTYQSAEAIHFHDLNILPDPLDQVIQSFHQKQREMIQNYLKMVSNREIFPKEGLYVLQESQWSGHPSSKIPLPLKTTLAGGYYLKWQEKGIVINPGPHFLDFFHQQGLHIKDIDIVIVTQSDPHYYADIQEIHSINAQLNKETSDLKMIHYFLVQNAYENLSSLLKPHFRQERQCIHPLEFFIDSTNHEKIEITPHIILNYFSSEKNLSQPWLSQSMDKCSSIGIRLDLLKEHQPNISLGYISHTPWSPFLAHHLSGCDLLIAGFGHTSIEDSQRIYHNEDCLGYNGTLALLEQIQPKLLLCTEFDQGGGDVRLEVIKKMRHAYSQSYSKESSTFILPGDKGLFLDLANFTIDCSITKQPMDLQSVQAIQTKGKFHAFQYLSSSCYC